MPSEAGEGRGQGWVRSDGEEHGFADESKRSEKGRTSASARIGWSMAMHALCSGW